MGNFCSKCQGKTKYKEKHKQLAQPNQVESTVKVATIKGDIHETINLEPNTNDTNTTNNRSLPHAQPPPENQRTNQDSPKRHKKRRGRTYDADTDDSSDTSSSTETSSSDSDKGGYSKSSRKMYKNKGGGTTIVSNKTIVGGNYMAIGKNAKNVVVTINNGRTNEKKKTKTKPSNPSAHQETAPTGPCTELFSSFYTHEAARAEEKKLLASPIDSTGDPAPLPGNFIQIHEQTSPVISMKVLGEWSDSICQIRWPSGNATGFRVGQISGSPPYYIMTAKHVLEAILQQDYIPVGSNHSRFKPLEKGSVFAVFDFLMNAHQINERNKFYFKSHVHFLDEETDCAILELKPKEGLPKPFRYFSIPKLDKMFHLIGHPENAPKDTNKVQRFLNTHTQTIQKDIATVRQWSKDKYMKDYDVPPYNVLTNKARFLFHCSFTEGASGSPGIVVLPDTRVVVVTMLLRGFPGWYYSEDLDPVGKANVPDVCRIEQGASMLAIYNKMKADRQVQESGLCNEIFGSYDSSMPV